MDKTKKSWLEFLFWLQQATAVWLRHRTPFAYGGDNDWMGYLLRQRTILLRFDADNRSCVVHLPRDAADQRCTQSYRYCCCRAQGFLSHMCTTRITYGLPYRLLQICSYAGARAEHLLSLAQHLATHALCCGGCSFQTRNRSISTQVDYLLFTANRQTSPSMMVGSPRNLQGCMHHTHLPVGVFEACGDCCGICVCREMSIRVSKSKTPSRVEISLTIFLYPYRFYFPVLLE